MKLNGVNVELNKIYYLKFELELQRHVNSIKGFINIGYLHRLSHGTRQVVTPAFPKHAAACLV